MAKIAGRNGQIYLDQSADGTGAATPLVGQAQWTLEATSEQIDVTSFGDQTKTYVAGLPDAKGSVSGFYDDTASTGSTALFTVATSGVARKMYLYPKTPSTAGPYFFGTANASFSFDTSVSDAVKVTGDWSAATEFFAIG